MDAGGWASRGRLLTPSSRTSAVVDSTGEIPRIGPLYERRDELVAKFGEARADCVIENPEPLPLSERLFYGPVLVADPHLSARSLSTRRR